MDLATATASSRNVPIAGIRCRHQESTAGSAFALGRVSSSISRDPKPEVDVPALGRAGGGFAFVSRALSCKGVASVAGKVGKHVAFVWVKGDEKTGPDAGVGEDCLLARACTDVG